MAEKFEVFGVGISNTTYADATEEIVDAAKRAEGFAVSALAVHGLMEAQRDDGLREALNEKVDLVTPDGQPVRWALNRLHGLRMSERVYGPDLTWAVLSACQEEDLGVYLFGSTEEVLKDFAQSITIKYPGLRIVGMQADRFRDATPEEDLADVAAMHEAGAHVVLVGRGCPRQEWWVADHRDSLRAVSMAVGAAFDFGAGNKPQAPKMMQRLGLEWLFRLSCEPRRLWKRYLVTNTRFLALFASAAIKKSLPFTGREEVAGR